MPIVPNSSSSLIDRIPPSFCQLLYNTKAINSTTYMASSLPSSCSFSLRFCRLKELKYPQVRSQSLRDDGASSNMVDANMGVLRERIAEVTMKERLEICCRLQNGWNYGSGYDHKHKRYEKLAESLEAICLGGGALGLVFLSGSICIFLVSLLVHFNY